MGLVAVADLEPGMVVAKDVKDQGGRIMLRAGNEISEKHLGILKKWGIHDVDVEGHGEEERLRAPAYPKAAGCLRKIGSTE